MPGAKGGPLCPGATGSRVVVGPGWHGLSHTFASLPGGRAIPVLFLAEAWTSTIRSLSKPFEAFSEAFKSLSCNTSKPSKPIHGVSPYYSASYKE